MKTFDLFSKLDFSACFQSNDIERRVISTENVQLTNG